MKLVAFVKEITGKTKVTKIGDFRSKKAAEAALLNAAKEMDIDVLKYKGARGEYPGYRKLGSGNHYYFDVVGADTFKQMEV